MTRRSQVFVRFCLVLLVLSFALGCAPQAFGHETRPAYLEVKEVRPISTQSFGERRSMQECGFQSSCNCRKTCEI